MIIIISGARWLENKSSLLFAYSPPPQVALDSLPSVIQVQAKGTGCAVLQTNIRLAFLDAQLHL